MNLIRHTSLSLVIAVSIVAVAGCAVEPASNTNSVTPAGSPSPPASASPADKVSVAIPVTLPVLDALLSDDAFKSNLKSKVDLTDDQIAQLRKVAADEVAKLRETTAEGTSGTAEQSRQRAVESIRGIIGEQKADALFDLAREYWAKGGENKENPAEAPVKAAPNAVPKDTRVVVNIPAYRMDVFQNGSLVKSYKIGIGYPDFPLPTGLRKAETIIFNPTWTPPDEPWVAKMKNVNVGEKVAAGSKLNPLGPIKIPIGSPSLIHGGKSPAKLGTFASHGCVGLTSPQVQDFSKLLAQVAGSEISDAAFKSYFADKTKTKVVKLGQTVPVELRYETIVVEDGKLHIYRDVYDQDTNTEENLRAVLEAHGASLDDFTEAERTQVLFTLNAMSRNPKIAVAASKSTPASSPRGSAVADTAEKKPVVAEAKKPAAKPIGKNQKEVVIELAALKGKGYPSAVNFDTGAGKPAPKPKSTAAVASAR
ncbi:MAG: L,D-transpeptidase family protein [Pyrinomonadaceae bacterium]|nr:L,D-transpeptidase family protein [Pyrinomonadaceae bacterium]